jgi:hypothetical protein
VLQLSVLPELLERNSLQKSAIIQNDNNAEALSRGNGNESENMLFAFSAPNDLPNNLLRIVLEL